MEPKPIRVQPEGEVVAEITLVTPQAVLGLEEWENLNPPFPCAPPTPCIPLCGPACIPAMLPNPCLPDLLKDCLPKLIPPPPPKPS